ncbi:MAG: type II secretion system protein [Deltaproteobacteria bacterium]|nr:type II secretion system protein [Deltaproteobacteria bacterium]
MERVFSKKGFTLIELSIVLVIIGLLIGAVIKGGSLIADAKMKRLKNDVDGWIAAVHSYSGKYNAIPGDDPQASTRFAGAANGNGDGLITETTTAWDHLRGAGIIAGQRGVGQSFYPKTSYGGYAYYVYRIRTGWSGNVVEISISGDVAQDFDTRYDDGVANTGDIQRSDGNAAWGTTMIFMDVRI